MSYVWSESQLLMNDYVLLDYPAQQEMPGFGMLAS